MSKVIKVLYTLILVACLLLPVIPVIAAGNTYYVAKTGSDSNNGTTLATAWKTIQKAAATMTAGDTVYVKAGVYNEQITPANSGSSGNYITYQAYPGDTVVIDGTGIDMGVNLNETWADGLVKIWNKSYLIFDGFEIYNADTHGSDGVTIYAQDGSSCNYITLQNLKIHKTGRSGIDFVTSGPSGTGRHYNMTVYNCEIYDTNYAMDQEAISMSHVEGGEVSYCTVYEMYNNGSYRQQGIDVKDSSEDVLVHHNEVYTCSVGIYIDSAVSATVYNNIIHNTTNSGPGIMIGNETTTTGNLTYSIYNNIVYSCPMLFATNDNDTDTTWHWVLSLVNNTFYDFQVGGPGAIAITVTDATFSSSVIRNNIFCDDQTGYSINLLYTEQTPSNITIDHNSYYNPGGVATATRLGTNYVTTNPLMTDPTDNDFTLQSTSPCIDAGSSTLAPATDYDGEDRPQGSVDDIGAYEYVAESSTYTPGVYTQPITVKNANSSLFTYQSLLATFGTTNLITGGYISSTGLDTRVKDGSTELKHMLTNDKILFVVPSLAANTTKNLTFSSGNTPLTSFPIIVGEGGYITTTDNAALEPGDRFKLIIALYLPAKDCFIFNKDDSIAELYDYSERELSVVVGDYETPDYILTATSVEPGEHVIKIDITYTESSSEEVVIYPASAGDYQNIPDEYPDGADHHLILESYTVPYDNYVIFPNTGASDLYVFDEPVGLVSLDAVDISFWFAANYPFSSFRYLIKMPGYSLWQSESVDPYGSMSFGTPVYKHRELLTNPVTGNAWQLSDLTGIQFGIYADRYSGSIAALQMYATLSAGLSVPYINFYVDDMETPEDSEILTAAIPDTAADWVWYPDPYFNYIKLETGN